MVSLVSPFTIDALQSATGFQSPNFSVDSSGNIIIYDPEYNSTTNPVYYQSPNIIVPNPANNNNVQPSTTTSYSPPPPSNSSSSPAYQS